MLHPDHSRRSESRLRSHRERLFQRPAKAGFRLYNDILAGAGVVLGCRFRVLAGPLLVPLCLGIVLQDTGAVTIALPPWLLTKSYAVLGWSIGLEPGPVRVIQPRQSSS